VGRPRNESNPDVACEDDIIAGTVHKLVMWGFPQRRDGAFQAVARAIEEVNFFGDNFRERSVGEDRVEQIYKTWRFKKKHSGWRYLYEPGRFTHRSLMLRRPSGSIDELACNSLRNKGSRASSRVCWPEAPVTESAQLTPKAQAEMDLMPRLQRTSQRHPPLLHAVRDKDGQLYLVWLKRGSKSSSS